MHTRTHTHTHAHTHTHTHTAQTHNYIYSCITSHYSYTNGNIKHFSPAHSFCTVCYTTRY